MGTQIRFILKNFIKEIRAAKKELMPTAHKKDPHFGIVVMSIDEDRTVYNERDYPKSELTLYSAPSIGKTYTMRIAPQFESSIHVLNLGNLTTYFSDSQRTPQYSGYKPYYSSSTGALPKRNKERNATTGRGEERFSKDDLKQRLDLEFDIENLKVPTYTIHYRHSSGTVKGKFILPGAIDNYSVMIQEWIAFYKEEQ